jgi:hypothetical protein
VAGARQKGRERSDVRDVLDLDTEEAEFSPGLVASDEGYPREAQEARHVGRPVEALDETRLDQIEVVLVWRRGARGRLMERLPLRGWARSVMARAGPVPAMTAVVVHVIMWAGVMVVV